MCIRDVERCTGAGRREGNENGMHMPQACAFGMWRGAPGREGEMHRGRKKGENENAFGIFMPPPFSLQKLKCRFTILSAQ